MTMRAYEFGRQGCAYRQRSASEPESTFSFSRQMTQRFLVSGEALAQAACRSPRCVLGTGHNRQGLASHNPGHSVPRGAGSVTRVAGCESEVMNNFETVSQS